MKILYYSDIHFRETGSFPPFNTLDSNGLTRELNNIIRGCTFVADMIRSVKPDVVICSGDIFHNMELIPVRVLHGVDIGLSEIKEACKETSSYHINIPGNHDIYNEVNMITSVSILRGYFDKVIFRYTELTHAGVSIALMPYTSDRSQIYHSMIDAKANCDVLSCHMDFDGAFYDNLHPIQGGLSASTGIPTFSGHLHLAHDIGDVSFIGSLFQHRFVQANDKYVGGILVYDTDTKTRTRVKNNYSKHYIKAYSSADVLRFDPDRYVFQVSTREPKDVVEAALVGYTYTYIHSKEISDGIKTTYINSRVDDPLVLLKNHIESDNPDAIEVYHNVIKG